MSTESPQEVIQTATVAIFSPEMTEVLLIYNAKIDGLVPVGGKFDPKKDRNIDDTAVREALEESQICLSPGLGTFLEDQGNPVQDQRVIQVKNFLFPDGKKGNDTLYFFRLHQAPGFQLPMGLYFLGKDLYSKERIEIDGKMYQFRALDARDKILAVMK